MCPQPYGPQNTCRSFGPDRRARAGPAPARRASQPHCVTANGASSVVTKAAAVTTCFSILVSPAICAPLQAMMVAPPNDASAPDATFAPRRRPARLRLRAAPDRRPQRPPRGRPRSADDPSANIGAVANHASHNGRALPVRYSRPRQRSAAGTRRRRWRQRDCDQAPITSAAATTMVAIAVFGMTIPQSLSSLAANTKRF